MKGKQKLGLILVGLGLVFLYPIESTTVPSWRLQVVDRNGKPAVAHFVRQSWKNYSVETREAREEDKWTDQDGFVSFEKRTVSANLLRRFLVPLGNIVRQANHASFGSSAYVATWTSDGKYSFVSFEPNKPMPTQ